MNVSTLFLGGGDHWYRQFCISYFSSDLSAARLLSCDISSFPGFYAKFKDHCQTGIPLTDSLAFHFYLGEKTSISMRRGSWG